MCVENKLSINTDFSLSVDFLGVGVCHLLMAWTRGMNISNFQDAVKTVVRGKFLSISPDVKTLKRHQANTLTIHLKELEK